MKNFKRGDLVYDYVDNMILIIDSVWIKYSLGYYKKKDRTLYISETSNLRLIEKGAFENEEF